MAENLDGLRPVQGRNTGGRRKQGRVDVGRTQTQTTGLTPSASRVQSYAGAPAVQRNNNAENLARALGITGGALSSFADTIQAKTDTDILNSAEYHMEKIREELGTGIISSVQVGEKFPEASHTVVAKISQALGAKQSEEMFQPYLEMIEQDDSLRLDSAARNELLATIREEAKGVSDDPFFLNGVMERLDAQINQNEQRWLLETAKYHKEVVAEKYTSEIAELLSNGGDLLAWDATAKQTGPFPDKERNELVAQTAINLAVDMQDPEVLARVPERFLNAQTKRDFSVIGQQIETAAYTRWSQQRTMADEARKQTIRDGQVAIINEFIDNGMVDPIKYRNTPELYAYALQMAQSDAMDTTTSVANSQKITSNILKVAFTGDVEGTLGQMGFSGPVTEGNLIDFVSSTSLLNPSEKQKLIPQIGKLMEGQAILQDPMVSNTITNYLRPQLDVLRRSGNQMVQGLDGTNLEAEVIAAYEDELLMSFASHYSETSEWPQGVTKQGMVREARKNALDLLKELTSVNNIGMTTQQAQDKLAPKRFNPNNGKLE